MKKSIFLFFAAILCAMTANAETYRYSGEKDGWAGTEMTASTDGFYSYYGPVTGAHKFKIGTSSDQWAYNYSYVSKGFNNTDIEDIGDWGSDNCYTWTSATHYILVYYPNTTINTTNKVKICASTVLPNDAVSEPEPEPEPVADVTVHFINTPNWAEVACHHWIPDGAGTSWPGEVLSKTDEIAGYDVYTATFTGAHTSCIFNNNNKGSQTGDLTVNDGKYYEVNTNTWYADKAAAEAALATPIPDETVYLINTGNWSKVMIHTWNGVGGTAWPGVEMTPTGETIEGYDVYSYTAKQGGQANLLFQESADVNKTGDLEWEAGKYYAPLKNEWYDTKEAAAEALAAPVEYDYVYLINTNDWAKAHIYTWTPEVAGWPGAQMTKEATQIAGKDVYSYKVVKGTTFGGLNFNCGGDECKTGDLEWNAGKYYAPSTSEWYADAATAEAALAAVVTYDYYIVGSFNGDNPADEDHGMTLDGTVYKATVTLAAGDNTLKVTDGTWENTWGYNELGAAYEGVSDAGEYNNIKITLAAEKEITVIFDATAGNITFENLTEITEGLTYTVETPLGTENCYIASATTGWNFRQMEPTDEDYVFTITIVGAQETDEYKYACQADWAYAEVIEGGGNRTAWQELDQVEEWGKPVIVTYQLKGVGGWEQPGIELVQNPGNDKEYMLTCQAISATDAIKVVRLEDGVIKDYYGNGTVKDGVTVDVSYDGEANIKLPAGTYNFYFDTNASEKKLWIEAATDCQTVTEITLTEGDNSSALATEGVVTVTVDRDFEKGKLYTIALPFTINTAASVFGNGTVVYNFANLAYDKTNEEYILGFTKVSKIEAGKPYLIEPGQDVDGFVAENVTLSSATSVSKTVKVDNVEKTATMTAVLSKTTTGGSYWLAEDRYLYNGEVNMPALRALFVLPTTPSGMPARARVALKEDAATGVEDLFTTDAPVKVIQNGQLIIIRDGVKYNVQGQVIR